MQPPNAVIFSFSVMFKRCRPFRSVRLLICLSVAVGLLLCATSFYNHPRPANFGQSREGDSDHLVEPVSRTMITSSIFSVWNVASDWGNFQRRIQINFFPFFFPSGAHYPEDRSGRETRIQKGTHWPFSVWHVSRFMYCWLVLRKQTPTTSTNHFVVTSVHCRARTASRSYTLTPVHRRARTQSRTYTVTPVHRRARTPSHAYAVSPVHRRARTPSRPYTSRRYTVRPYTVAHVHRRARTPSLPYSATPVRRRAPTPSRPYTVASIENTLLRKLLRCIPGR